MSGSLYDPDELKRKIRRLKKLEITIRFGCLIHYDKNGRMEGLPGNVKLVWDEFFDINGSDKNTKYSISEILKMNKESFKAIISEYFFNVYYRYYKENGMTNIPVFDPEILTQMGLPMDSGSEDIKKRFRELAKKYHPDKGGDSMKFIELMDKYKRLID